MKNLTSDTKASVEKISISSPVKGEIKNMNKVTLEITQSELQNCKVKSDSKEKLNFDNKATPSTNESSKLVQDAPSKERNLVDFN